jgi:hypothetical protein
MKVEKEKFDSLLGKMIKAKPATRKNIKTSGKGGKPIIPSADSKSKNGRA